MPLSRALAGTLSAVSIVAVGVVTAALMNHDSGATPPRSVTTPRSGTTPAAPADPKDAAVRTAQTALDRATVLPGATRLAGPPLPALAEPPSSPGAQHVQLTRFWSAPGRVAAAIGYLQAHPPAGFGADGSGSVDGPGVATNRQLFFRAGPDVSVLYDVVAFRGGVAVRADAQVLWAPSRSPADRVGSPLASVAIVVIRKNPQLHQGAPTVRRTLTGAAAQRLAAAVDAMPRAVPLGPVSCPAELGGAQWSDQLDFRGAGPAVRVFVNLAGCSYVRFTAGRRAPILLDGNLDAHVMRALGLPAGYGG